jgi:hypothetical protein
LAIIWAIICGDHWRYEIKDSFPQCLLCIIPHHMLERPGVLLSKAVSSDMTFTLIHLRGFPSASEW